MAGIKDIAKKAGCSISTVSYALNGSPKVTEETRERILQIAKELDYVPNGAARMLRAKETKIIGCFVGDYSGSFYGRLLSGIREVLNDAGYELIACSGERSRRLLLERMMDGAIILDRSFTDKDLLNYAELGHKMVILDREIIHENIVTVLLDNKTGAELATEALLKQTISKLYIVSGPKISYDAQERLNAAKTFVSTSDTIPSVEIAGNFTKESGVDAATQILNEYDGHPVGVFCLNDEMAIGIYDRLRDSKLTIGKDVFVVGFDNIELANYMVPRLTSINYSMSRWGRTATQNLLQLLAGVKAPQEKLSVKLTQGGSC